MFPTSNVCVTIVFISDLWLSLWGMAKLCSSFRLHVTLPIARPLRRGKRTMSIGIELPKTIALFGMLMEYSTLFGQRFSTDYINRLIEKTHYSRRVLPWSVIAPMRQHSVFLQFSHAVIIQRSMSIPNELLPKSGSVPFSQQCSERTLVGRLQLLAGRRRAHSPTLRLTREDLCDTRIPS